MTAPRLALVTGASRGLGAAIAEHLAARGWHVVAVARTVGGLEELDDRVKAALAGDIAGDIAGDGGGRNGTGPHETGPDKTGLDHTGPAPARRGGGGLTLAPMDITTEDAMRHLCRAIHDRWGQVDLWAHAAIHAPPLSPAAHLDLRDWEKSVNTNTRATGQLIPMIEPLLRAAPQGTALFFDDPRAGAPFFGAYGATKAAQIALARSWQAETLRTGPRIRIGAPAPMPTALRARFFPGEDRSRLSPPAVEAARLIADL